MIVAEQQRSGSARSPLVTVISSGSRSGASVRLAALSPGDAGLRHCAPHQLAIGEGARIQAIQAVAGRAARDEKIDRPAARKLMCVTESPARLPPGPKQPIREAGMNSVFSYRRHPPSEGDQIVGRSEQLIDTDIEQAVEMVSVGW
jgi:hypothetical protein